MGIKLAAETRPEAHHGARLDLATNSGNGPWLLNLYPSCGEGSISWSAPVRDREYVPPGEGADPDRALREAARRAASTLRRFCTAHGLDRLGTLTYRCRRCDVAPCVCDEGPDRPTESDRDEVVADVERFRKRLSRLLGERVALAAVIEHHANGVLHVHFAFGQYLQREVIERAWGRGWVELRRFRGPGLVKVGKRERCRRVAAYLTSYLKKEFTDGHAFGRHRYSTTRGIAPEPRRVRSMRRHEALSAALDVMGTNVQSVWDSQELDEWEGPPVLVVFWGDSDP